jgi:hypothetical protein
MYVYIYIYIYIYDIYIYIYIVHFASDLRDFAIRAGLVLGTMFISS